MTERFRLPTPEEIYAIEQAARRLRAQTIARLLRAAGRTVSALAVRSATALADRIRRTPARVRHSA